MLQSGISFVTDTSRTDYNVIADMNAGTDHRVSADPAVISDDDLLAVFIGGVPCIRMDRMSRCIDRHIGGHLAVVAYLYLCNINDRTVIIGEKVFAHFYMTSVITVKRAD